MLVRTGQLSRARREGWGDYAGGAAPGLSFTTAGWLHRTEIAAIATDTWGFEVRPNEFDDAFQPLHQVAIPHIGLLIGEMWDLDALAARLRRRRRLRVLAHRRARSRSPARSAPPSTPSPSSEAAMPAVGNVLVVGCRHRRHRALAILLAARRRRRRPGRDQARDHRARLRHHAAGQRPARAARPRRLGPGPGARVRLRLARAARRTRTAPCSPSSPTPAPAAPDLPATVGMYRPDLARILTDRGHRGRREAAAATTG